MSAACGWRVWSIAIGDCAPGRGEHLDDDVPIVTPLVQQAEQAADAADTHMSVGKMEMMSRAAAKMTNSAAAGELTSDEIWTLAKMAIELFGASVSKFANKFTSYSNDSSLIIDMAAKRDDRQFWELGTREEKERLEQTQQENQTELLIGSAPCKSFRTLLHPCVKGTKERIEKAQDEERQYTQACIKAYKRQLSMVDISCTNTQCISDGRTHLVQGPMCRWRMTATDDRHGQGFVRGQTRWATSSSRHAGENRRVRVDWAERDRCTHRDL